MNANHSHSKPVRSSACQRKVLPCRQTSLLFKALYLLKQNYERIGSHTRGSPVSIPPSIRLSIRRLNLKGITKKSPALAGLIAVLNQSVGWMSSPSVGCVKHGVRLALDRRQNQVSNAAGDLQFKCFSIYFAK